MRIQSLLAAALLVHKPRGLTLDELERVGLPVEEPSPWLGGKLVHTSEP